MQPDHGVLVYCYYMLHNSRSAGYWHKYPDRVGAFAENQVKHRINTGTPAPVPVLEDMKGEYL